MSNDIDWTAVQPGKVWLADSLCAPRPQPGYVGGGVIGGGAGVLSQSGQGALAALGYPPQLNSQFNPAAFNPAAYLLLPTDPIERLIYNAITSSRGGAVALAREIREQIDMYNLAAAWGLKLAKPVEKPPV